jgi:hypothetical protein
MDYTRHILFGLHLLVATLCHAQSKWDSYDNVLQAVLNGDLVLPETENFKITIGPNQLPATEVATGKSWVYYLIKWKLNADQINMGFVLRDTFDSALDGTSITMLGSSNHYQLNSNGKQVFTWNLSGAQSDADTKEGHVYFKVKIKADTPPNTTIRNTAFMDLKDGQLITTTTAVIQIIGLADWQEPQMNEPSVVPNPNSGVFTLHHPLMSADDQIYLFDAFGKSHDLSCSEVSCSVAQGLTGGIYQLLFQDTKTGSRFATKLLIRNEN